MAKKSLLITLVSLLSLLFIVRLMAPQRVIHQASPSLMTSSFTQVYASKRWGVGSGEGSNPKNAEPYLQLLQQYLSDPRLQSIVDLGCGDWQLMRTMQLSDAKQYEGFDVVKSIIENDTKHYQKPNVNFYLISGLGDFKTKNKDLLIVKDVLQHWPNHDIHYFLTHVLPKFRYALITNDYMRNNTNGDINTGEYRPIDLTAVPFNFKAHLSVLLDYSVHGATKRVYLYTNPTQPATPIKEAKTTI